MRSDEGSGAHPDVRGSRRRGGRGGGTARRQSRPGRGDRRGAARPAAARAEDAALEAALAEAPALLARTWEADWSALAAGLDAARGLYVVGRGLGLGIAQEAALKLKETCGLHAEPFSAAEVRHGPMA